MDLGRLSFLHLTRGLAFMVMCLVAVDDATMNALFDQEAKLFEPHEREETGRKTHYLGNKCVFVNV